MRLPCAGGEEEGRREKEGEGGGEAREKQGRREREGEKAMTLLTPDPIDFDDTWVLLESSLITILQDLRQGLPNDLWISLFTGVYKLCTKPNDPQHSKLYGRLKVPSVKK